MKNDHARPLPDLPGESDELLQQLIEVIGGEDLYWERRFTDALSNIGLKVQRIQREESHPCVWVLSLKVSSHTFPADKKAASKCIRRALKDNGLGVKKDEFTILERRESCLKCVFVFGALPSFHHDF